jgi:cytidyltransferase-like protein
MPSSQVKLGPEPTLISRKEVDVLYETLAAVRGALDRLGVQYIVTGGSLLGAIRQHSLLFCDDDIDVTIIDTVDEHGVTAYERMSERLVEELGDDYQYSIRPWEGGDKVRHKRMTSVFVDIFTLRRFGSAEELRELISLKRNGQPQSDQYVEGILRTVQACAVSQGEAAPLFPCWHFNTRKAVEMWPKEVYREAELFPLCSQLKFGPLEGISGPRMPVLLLRRAFGRDCFEVYYQSCSHKAVGKAAKAGGAEAGAKGASELRGAGGELPALTLGGGTWEAAQKALLQDEQYVPMQPVDRAKRRPTPHGREQLLRYLEEQGQRERAWREEEEEEGRRRQSRAAEGDDNQGSGGNGGSGSGSSSGGGSGGGGGSTSGALRPERTVYMDGVFDLFHIGHLEALRQCAALGSRVVIGVTGDADATAYKRAPVIRQAERSAIVGAVREVDAVVCPCPLVVTEEFMREHGIDLVVHGFADDADAKRQEEFFAAPMKAGRFQRIPYYQGQSTSAIIERIRTMDG